MGLGLGLYYYYAWRNIDGFVAKIDKNRQLFEDLRLYFYPAGRDFLLTRTPDFGYFYSAFFALLLVPLGQLTLNLAEWIWGGIELVAFAGVCLVPLRRMIRLSQPGIILYLGLCLTSFPAFHNFSWGQVGMPLTFLTLLAVHYASGNRPLRSGILLALATSIKYYSGLFLLFFLIRKNRRAVLSFVVAGVVFFVLAPMIVLGPAGWIRFHLSVMENFSRVNWITPNSDSQYFAHVLFRWIHLPSPARDTGGPIARALALVALAIVLFNMSAIRRLERMNHPDSAALIAASLFLSLPFLLKTSWPHYFVYLPFCQTAILCALRDDGRIVSSARNLLAVFPLVSIVLSSIFFFEILGNRTTYESWGCLFIANALLLLPIHVIAHISGRERMANTAPQSANQIARIGVG